ncbi:MAG: hypothetical protein ACQZ3N_06295, partial [cyanobacterium endosymbiont of Rhopalodia yunnanensis]
MNNYIFLIRRRTYTYTVVDSEVTQYFLENKSKNTARNNNIRDLPFIVKIFTINLQIIEQRLNQNSLF